MTADSFTLLMNATLAATVAIFAVAVMRGKLRQLFGARVAYTFWLIVPMAVIASMLPTGIQTVSVDRESAIAQQFEVPAAASMNAVAPTSPSAAVAQTTDASLSLSDVAPWLLAVWGIGAVAAFALQLGAHWHFVHRNRLSGGRPRIQRASSSDVAPSIIGLVKPYIIVPKNFVKQFSKLERRLILAHERAHLTSGDVPTNLLALMIRSLFWFNPVAYVGHQWFRADQELACDERVMQAHGQHRRLYAETLLKSQLMTQTSPLGCALGRAGHPLKERVARLSNSATPRGRRMLGAISLVALSAFSSSIAWATLSSHVVYVENEAQQEDREDSSFGRGWRGEREDDGYSLDDAQGAALVNAMLDRRYNHARALIDGGANVNYKLRGDGTALMVAVARDNRAMMELLLSKGADVDGYVPGDGTALVIAARRDNLEAAKFLIEAGADVNKAAPGDGNPLIMAARHGSLDLVKLLVDSGADVDGFVLGDETPLIGAARQNQLDVAAYLIENGADVNLRVETGNGRGRAQYRSPMGQARLKGNSEMAELLRNAGATPAPTRED
ncbi:MAG: ankyrin repeat domain-containing protein [Kordiimonadaceae bacterium]|nr:ankyrin repeat domain-containing protein [Kordiimonadaceae bacterium]MBO6567705.1 ankyrin repeat domain-containing protein [Kordiimonadaceae bacterium]